MKELSDNYKLVTKRDMARFQHTMLVAQNISLCRYKMAAQIFIGAKPVSVAVNEIKTHPVFKRYPEHTVSIHCEIRAIIKAKSDLSGSTLYVARYGGGSSMPCMSCRSFIQEANIKYIVYTLNGTLLKEAV